MLDGARNAYRDIALFNAAAALVVAGAARDLADGVARGAARARRRRGARRRWSDLSTVSNA